MSSHRLAVPSPLLFAALALTACFEPVIKTALPDAGLTDLDSGVDAGGDAGGDAGLDPRDGGLTCGSGLTLCGTDVCTDTGSDESNCGQCNISCSAAQACVQGACVTSCTPGVSCTPAAACSLGTLSCSTGAPVCDVAGPAPVGTSCGAQQVCDGAGACVPGCFPNQSCSTNPGSPCLRGATACASGPTGAATCVDDGPTPAGDSCGGSQVCNGSGTCISLVTCYVTPSAGDRTLVMSTRNWFGYTRPVTVFYKMVGGGAGPAILPGTSSSFSQLVSAGGSTALLKNGTLVAAAAGMNASDLTNPRQLVSGVFTVSNTDTIRLVTGGGGGYGSVATYFTGAYDYYGLPGGGGAGYYGGGSGVRQDWVPGPPVAGTAVAFGGTGLAGGAGAASGALGNGGSTDGGASGGNGASNGASLVRPLWNGFLTVNYTAGGGGGYGQPGLPGGENQYCPSNPENSNRGGGTPLATTFDLSPVSGTAGFQQGWNVPGGGYWSCGVGGAAGEIVFQYLAPTCDLIPQWNAP